MCDAWVMTNPYLPIDVAEPRVIELFDELPLWSAPFGQLLLDRVPMLRGSTILDIGTGTGFLALELAQRYGSTATVIAVDPWSAAIVRLRRKISLLGLSNIQVIECAAEDLDLPERSVDLVVSNLGLNNFENPTDVLERCRTLAREGAKLALTTNLVGHMDELYEELGASLVALDLSDCLAALEIHRQHRGTMESTAALLESASFEVVEMVSESFRLRYVDGTAFLRNYFIRLGFPSGWHSLVPESKIASVFANLEERLNQRAAKEGELVMTIPVAYIEANAR